VHLAAQAGVRYSIENPRAYVEANLVGAFNVMESMKLKYFRRLRTCRVLVGRAPSLSRVVTKD